MSYNNWQDKILTEEIEAAQARVKARLAQGEEELKRQARIAELAETREALAAQYEALLEKAGSAGETQAERQRITAEIVKASAEIEALSPKDAPAPLPGDITAVYVIGKSGGRM